jgi:predicted PurR-regulated permease PerM
MDIQYPSRREITGKNIKLSTGLLCGGLIIVLALWILQSFLLPVLVACVTAIASWPLHRRFAARIPPSMPCSTNAFISTALVTAFVLVPMTFAFTALAGEAQVLILAIAAVDKEGIAPPHWLGKL